MRASFLDNGANEEYDVVIYDYGSKYKDDKIVLDTAELAEKLPGLEKLFISAYVEISDMSAFSKLSDLKELQIDVSGSDDISMLSGLILIFNQPIDKSSAEIIPFVVKLPCKATSLAAVAFLDWNYFICRLCL